MIRSARTGTEGDHRRDGKQPPVFEPDELPPALVNHPVMPVAQQHEVLEVGRAPMDPVDDELHEVDGVAFRTIRPLSSSLTAASIGAGSPMSRMYAHPYGNSTPPVKAKPEAYRRVPRGIGTTGWCASKKAFGSTKRYGKAGKPEHADGGSAPCHAWLS